MNTLINIILNLDIKLWFYLFLSIIYIFKILHNINFNLWIMAFICVILFVLSIRRSDYFSVNIFFNRTLNWTWWN